MSEESEYDTGEDILEEEETCDYTGDICVGDKMFCEECWLFQELTEEVTKKKKKRAKK
jgi:hypothetical protein